jgi:cellulose synthase/poly-beta-1,6-N-acetylglucosamine synthase-like glycosyltransferase
MLRVLAKTAQMIVLSIAGYNAVVALWGWKNRPAAVRGSGGRRLRIVVPAHDEEAVISGILGDLASDTYPAAEVVVLADRCTDQTAEVAAGRGVTAVERLSGPGGKGAALSWYLDAYPLDDDEALVVFDADNRLPPRALTRIADELDAGHEIVQCYLDVENPDGSVLATASAMSYWAGNRMVQLARDNLGWSSDLGGTGMAFTAEALDRIGGFGTSLTEDQEIGVLAALADVRVAWLHDVRIRDEKPTGLTTTVRQRSRWMSGKREVAKLYLRPLWSAAVERRSFRLFDQGLRLVQPGRSFVALMSGVMAVAAVATRSRFLLSPWIWITAAVGQFAQPIPFLLRDGVSPRYVVRYPFLAVLAALWIPIRLVSSRINGDWFHTPHGEATNPQSAPPPRSGGGASTGR